MESKKSGKRKKPVSENLIMYLFIFFSALAEMETVESRIKMQGKGHYHKVWVSG